MTARSQPSPATPFNAGVLTLASRSFEDCLELCSRYLLAPGGALVAEVSSGVHVDSALDLRALTRLPPGTALSRQLLGDHLRAFTSFLPTSPDHTGFDAAAIILLLALAESRRARIRPDS